MGYTIKLQYDYLQTFAFPHGQNTEKRKRPEAGPPKADKTLNEIYKDTKCTTLKKLRVVCSCIINQILLKKGWFRYGVSSIYFH